MTLAEKVITIADNTQAVCEAVKGAKVDVSGAVVSVGDVSSVEHSVGVKLTSDTLTDFSSVRVACSGGEDLFDDTILLQASGWQESDGIYYGKNDKLFLSFSNGYGYGGFPLGHEFKPNTAYTLTCTARCVLQGSENEKAVGFIFYYTDGTTEDRLYVTGRADFVTQSVTSNPNKSVSKIIATYNANGTLYLKDVRLTEGTPTTYTANADGTVDVTSLSPSMVLTTDNGGAVINARYFPVAAEGKQIAYAELKQAEKAVRDNI